MWKIIEASVNYSTEDVMKMYAVIAVVALIIVVVMFKSASNKDD